MTAPMQPQADLNARIPFGSDAWPRELWGKTVGEGIRYYGIMKQDFMARGAGAGQPAPTNQPAPAPAPPPAPTNWNRPPAPAPAPSYQPAPAPSGGAPPGFVDMDTVQRLISEAMESRLVPMQRVTQQTVYQDVRSAFPDWNFYDAEIQESLKDAPSDTLLNPSVWEAAYYFVKGKKLSQPGARPAAAAPMAPRRDYMVQTPPPAPSSAFVERPTAPPAGGEGMANMPTPEDELMARKFGVSVAEYVLWKGGNVPPMPAPAAPAPGGNNGWR